VLNCGAQAINLAWTEQLRMAWLVAGQAKAELLQKPGLVSCARAAEKLRIGLRRGTGLRHHP